MHTHLPGAGEAQIPDNDHDEHRVGKSGSLGACNIEVDSNHLKHLQHDSRAWCVSLSPLLSPSFGFPLTFRNEQVNSQQPCPEPSKFNWNHEGPQHRFFSASGALAPLSKSPGLLVLITHCCIAVSSDLKHSLLRGRKKEINK